MNIAIAYPLPIETESVWADFKPDVERFCRTWRRFPPGQDCTLFVLCCNRMPDQAVRDLFWGLPATFVKYDGQGCDIGAAQWLAFQLHPETFQVNLTSRVYFHRPNWLCYLATARQSEGAGLYGTSVSHEGGKFHLCTRCYAMDSGDFTRYPYIVGGRADGTKFEFAIGRWFKDQALPVNIVSFEGVRDWDDPDQGQNGFRRGDQSDLMVWDRHTQIWATADAAEKERLTRLCYETLL